MLKLATSLSDTPNLPNAFCASKEPLAALSMYLVKPASNLPASSALPPELASALFSFRMVSIATSFAFATSAISSANFIAAVVAATNAVAIAPIIIDALAATFVLKSYKCLLAESNPFTNSALSRPSTTPSLAMLLAAIFNPKKVFIKSGRLCHKRQQI